MPQFAYFIATSRGQIWAFVARKRSGALPSSAADGQNNRVDLARLAWLATVLICLITVLILVLQGYFGYAGVTFAVAVAAAINLF